jgi:hypothetical protein
LRLSACGAELQKTASKFRWPFPFSIARSRKLKAASRKLVFLSV